MGGVAGPAPVPVAHPNERDKSVINLLDEWVAGYFSPLPTSTKGLTKIVVCGIMPVDSNRQSKFQKTMNRFDFVLVLALVLLTGLPAKAYADPSGGTLFQILMPTLAAVWAIWTILANRIRKGLSAIFRKVRGIEPDEPTA